MRSRVPFIEVEPFPAKHGFFSRQGGVSHAPYASLNGGWHTHDHKPHVQENIRRIAESLGSAPQDCLSVDQVHGTDVVDVTETSPHWSVDERPRADALVSNAPGVTLMIATADCAPVLLASEDGSIIGAAHAGWRGAVAGVLEATVQHMRALGANNIVACVGPCIGATSYEVGNDMRDVVLKSDPAAERYFHKAMRPGHFLFDLPSLCVQRLTESGVTRVSRVDVDTVVEENYFSHRRATLAGSSITGRHISAIRRFS